MISMWQRWHTNLSIILNWYITKFSRDLCLPSLPAIALALHAPERELKYTVSFYFLGMGLSRFFFTPLSDMFGRRPIILYSLPIFIVGSILCVFTESIDYFMLGRLLQALGIGCITALGWAMIGDVYGAKGSTKALAYLSTFAMWAPALASTLGGYLQTHLGWKTSFYFLAISGFILYCQTCWGLQETNTYLLPKKAILRQVLHNYAQLIISPIYWRYMITFSLTFSGTVVYYATAPFLFINTYHIKPQTYGLFSFFTVSGLIVGKFLAIRTSEKYSIETTLLSGLFLSSLGGALMIFLALCFRPQGLSGQISTIILPTMIYFLGNGMMSPTAKAGTVTLIPGAAGTAAALFGLVQGLTASAAGIASAYLPNHSGLGMGTMFCLISVLALLSLWIFSPESEEETP